jgi:hypothetical protein
MMPPPKSAAIRPFSASRTACLAQVFVAQNHFFGKAGEWLVLEDTQGGFSRIRIRGHALDHNTECYFVLPFHQIPFTILLNRFCLVEV